MNTITEKELIEKGYKKVSNILYSKNVSLEEIHNKIKSYKNQSGNNKRELNEKLFGSNLIYRKYNKNNNEYVDVKYCRPVIKISKNKEILTFSDAISNLNKSKSEYRQEIYNNNLTILRKYHMGDSSKELIFQVDDISIPMEKYPNLLSKNNDFYFNMELHHIAMINGESRDKEDIDPNQWLKSVDMTKFEIIENIDNISYDNDMIIANNKAFHKELTVLGLTPNNDINLYSKTKTSLSRIKELMTILLAPKGVHAAVHYSTRNAGFSFYNLDALPYALKSEENYNDFLQWLQDHCKFRKTNFSSYNDHIKFLEI